MSCNLCDLTILDRTFLDLEHERINRTLNMCWYCSSNSYRSYHNDVTIKCVFCFQHKENIKNNDIMIGIDVNQCYCCSNSNIEVLMKCIFCDRYCCDCCRGKDNELNTITCIKCHPPVYDYSKSNRKLKNCCLRFMRANYINIKFKNNYNNNNNNNNNSSIEEKN